MTKAIPPLSANQYLSGKVRRWHTCVGLDQTNADHSHGVAFVIAMLHPNPSANLLKAALFHDLGELGSGDMPSPAKRDKILAERIKVLQQETLRQLRIPEINLTEEEQDWLSFADAYETYMFIHYAASGPSISHIEQDMVENKMREKSKALGIYFDVDLASPMKRDTSALPN